MLNIFAEYVFVVAFSFFVFFWNILFFIFPNIFTISVALCWRSLPTWITACFDENETEAGFVHYFDWKEASLWERFVY